MMQWIVSSSVLILVVIALRYVLRGKLSLRMQYSAQLDGRDRKPTMHNVDENPSLWATMTFVEE